MNNAAREQLEDERRLQLPRRGSDLVGPGDDHLAGDVDARLAREPTLRVVLRGIDRGRARQVTVVVGASARSASCRCQ